MAPRGSASLAWNLKKNRLARSVVLDRNILTCISKMYCDICMISVTTRYAQSAVMSQTNKRHMVAVKQLILIMLVYVISFLPLIIIMNGSVTSSWIAYLMYINNVANFFIYLAVNTEFRNEMKTTLDVILKKVRPGKEQKIFVMR